MIILSDNFKKLTRGGNGEGTRPIPALAKDRESSSPNPHEKKKSSYLVSAGNDTMGITGIFHANTPINFIF